MEYPSSKFTRPWRRLVLIVFLTSFFVLAPTIIAYTTGYRYDFKNGLLKETGAISVDILPKNAAVYLDGVKIKDKMPIRLKNINPNKYVIRISAAGYEDWEKEVEVKSKQTVYVKELRLLKNSEPFFLAGRWAQKLALSFDGRYLAYENTGDDAAVYIRDLATNNESRLARDNKEEIELSWSPQNYYLAVALGKKNHYNKLLIIDANNTDKMTDVTLKEDNYITKYQWKNSNDPELFYSTTNKIASIKPLTGNRFFITNNTFADWYMEEGALWTLSANKNNAAVITKDALGFSAKFVTLDDSESYEILAAHNDNVLLKQAGQPNMLLARSDKTFKIAGSEFLISPYNNWWLIWTPWEIWTYSEGEEPVLLNRSGEGLKQVLPLDEFNTLGLFWNQNVTALFPYYLVTNDLLNNPANYAVADTLNRVLYWSGTIESDTGIWKLEY